MSDDQDFNAMKPIIFAASEGPLSRAQAVEAFSYLFEGAATPAQMGGLIMAMRARGERAWAGAGRRDHDAVGLLVVGLGL